MLDKLKKEQNFIEKRREWKSGIDKPIGRRSLILALPALFLCVFVMMSAPYLKLLVSKFAKSGDEMNIALPLNLDDAENQERIGPPRSPDNIMLENYREQLEREGFDWRAKPYVDGPNLNFARDLPIELAPVPIDLPVTMTELERQSAAATGD